MEFIGLGVAAGLAAAAACLMFYRKGVRDGMAAREGRPAGRLRRQQSIGHESLITKSDENAAAMMKRYEAILSYDPYNVQQKNSPFMGEPEGERV